MLLRIVMRGLRRSGLRHRHAGSAARARSAPLPRPLLLGAPAWALRWPGPKVTFASAWMFTPGARMMAPCGEAWMKTPGTSMVHGSRPLSP